MRMEGARIELPVDRGSDFYRAFHRGHDILPDLLPMCDCGTGRQEG